MKVNFPKDFIANFFSLARIVFTRSYIELKKSPSLLLFSLIMSVSLWVFVTDNENPMITETFPVSINVQPVNIGPELAVANRIDKVQLRVSTTQEKLESCINSDLANNYGNLCQRVISFNEKNCNLQVPDNINFENDDLKLLKKVSDNISTLRSYIDNQELSIYSNFIIDCLFDANKYFNDQEPWKKKSDVVRLNTIVYVSLEIIRKISIMLNPIIPDTSLRVLEIFNLKQKDINFDKIKDHKCLIPNSNIKKIGILFKKIEKND